MTNRCWIRFSLFCLVFILTIPPMAIQAADPIESADHLYRNRRNHANVQAGIDLLTKVVEERPQYDALWRLARFYWFAGDRAEGKERLTLFERGKTYAEQATELNDNGLDGHYWFGSLIGCVGQEKGILNSLFMVKPMKREIERCLEIDPQHADSHDVMAQLLWKVPGFAGGNRRKALEEARLATVYGPEVIGFWLHYGQIAAANKDYRTARSALQKALSLPDDAEDPVGSRNDKKAAQDELKKIEGK